MTDFQMVPVFRILKVIFLFSKIQEPGQIFDLILGDVYYQFNGAGGIFKKNDQQEQYLCLRL